MSGSEGVVTGLGCVSAFGVGRKLLEEGLREGQPRLTAVDRSAGFHLDGSSRSAALVGTPSFRDWITPLAARRMSPPSRYAVVAAKTALEDAGHGIDEPDPAFGVTVSTAFGPSSYTQRLLDQILDEGPEAISPFLFSECVANAPAAQVSIHARACGPNHTLSEQEVGVLMATARGASDLRAGRVDRSLVGGVEEMTPLLHALLDRFRALARAPEGSEEAALPFGAARNGFLAAEGAALLFLERDADARARGAEPLARIAGWGAGFDPTTTRVGWGHGADRLAAGVRAGFGRHGIPPESIDLVVSGASGSIGGDRLEAAMLQALFGESPPPVIAPKAVTGEYGGVFLAAAVLAAAGKTISGDGGEPGRTLITSVAAGGGAAWLVLDRP